MFGYIRPYREELTLRQDAEYRAHYCGLCRALGLRRGLVGRALMRYDMVFVALLADAVAPSPDHTLRSACPLRGRVNKTRGASTEFAADLSLLLLHGKLLDDRADGERFAAPAQLMLAPITHGALRRQPFVYEGLCAMLRAQAALESAGCDLPDAAAEPTACFLRGTFGALPAAEGVDVEALRWLGYNLGKWVYLMDAVDDVGKDLKTGAYNVFKTVGIERARALATHCAAQAQAALDMLGARRGEALITNILSLGLSDVQRQVLEGAALEGPALQTTRSRGRAP